MAWRPFRASFVPIRTEACSVQSTAALIFGTEQAILLRHGQITGQPLVELQPLTIDLQHADEAAVEWDPGEKVALPLLGLSFGSTIAHGRPAAFRSTSPRDQARSNASSAWSASAVASLVSM